MFSPFYDAVMRFFAQAKHAQAEIPAVFARPDRAHQELRRVMSKRLQGKARVPGEPAATTSQALEDRPAALPFLSIYMPIPKYDRERFNPGRMTLSKDRQTGTAMTMRYPRPVKGMVQVDLWTATDLEAQQIAAQMDLRFNGGIVYLPIDWTEARWYRPPFNVLEHAKAFGQKRLELQESEGWDDTSDLEEGEGPKTVRWTWKGELKAHVPFRPEEARLVTRVGLELFDSADPAQALDAQETAED